MASVADAALRGGLDPALLAAGARDLSGPGATAARRAVAATDGRAESPLESCLRLVANPLGHVDLQVYVEGVGRVDGDD